MTTIAVAGGTGVVGRHVVEEVRRRGLDAVAAPMPGRVGRQVAEGGLLPRGEARLGVERFDEWLARR